MLENAIIIIEDAWCRQIYLSTSLFVFPFTFFSLSLSLAHPDGAFRRLAAAGVLAAPEEELANGPVAVDEEVVDGFGADDEVEGRW